MTQWFARSTSPGCSPPRAIWCGVPGPRRSSWRGGSCRTGARSPSASWISGSGAEMVATRLLDASRETVWKLWTDPAHIAEWWGPRGFTTTIHEMDVRPGGAWRHTMHGPDGADYPNSAVFLDVRDPERIAFLHGDPGEPDHFFTTVDFADEGGKTGVTIRTLFPSAADRERAIREYGAADGLEENMDKLAGYVVRLRPAS